MKPAAPGRWFREHRVCPDRCRGLSDGVERLAVAEVARLARGGGVFFGVASQGEPHPESLSHDTVARSIDELPRSAASASPAEKRAT